MPLTFSGVAHLTVPKEFRLGRRASDPTVEHRFCGLGYVGVSAICCFEVGVAPVAASTEFRLRRRASDCIVEPRVE